MAKPSELPLHPLTYAYWIIHETYDSKRMLTTCADMMELTEVIFDRRTSDIQRDVSTDPERNQN